MGGGIGLISSGDPKPIWTWETPEKGVGIFQTRLVDLSLGSRPPEGVSKPIQQGAVA